MTNKPLVSILIPSWNNQEYLRPCIVSLIRNRVTPGLVEIVVVNNGHPNSCDYLKVEKDIRILNAPDNLGWEGGIDFGLKNTDAPFVVFMNDDTLVPNASRTWTNQLLQHFRNPQVAAVGPASNTVMGFQNIFTDTPFLVFETKFIIGFCAMIRRSAFDEVGGMDVSLPGGDDLDWSIRFRKAGYKVLVDRSVFIYHHGFKTGERLNGAASATNGWNSYEMYSKTNTALIKKHGLATWYNTMRGSYEMPTVDYPKLQTDTEGKTIKKLVRKTDEVVLDLGCGPRKTLRRAIGIDFIKKGERIPTLDREVSDADIEADVSRNLPVPDGTADVIIARHILEHMIDPVSTLFAWVSKLKKGGRLIVAVPNEQWHLTIPMNVEHVHAFTPDSLAVLLTSVGLTNLTFVTSGNAVSFILMGEKK